MKLTCFLLLFFLPFFSSSQNWVQNNAVWHYDYWTIGWQGFIKIEYIGDSLIQGKTTMNLEVTDYRFSMDQFGMWHQDGEFLWGNSFLYKEGDTIFYLQNDQFHKLFDFSKLPGESYLIGETAGNSLCSSSSYIEVLDTGTTEIGYPYITLNSPDTAELYLYGEFNSRFGGGDYLLPLTHWCDPDIIVDYYSFNFKCFQDDSLFYNPSGEDCEYMLTHLDISEVDKQDITIYPNPTKDLLYINGMTNQISIRVIDPFDRNVLSYIEYPQTGINLTTLSSGLYIIEINSYSGTIRKSFIKE